MSLIIKPKRGTSTPSTSDIVNGEIAIDTSAQLLYINDNGSIKTIGDGTGSSGTVSEAFKTISVSGQSDVVADSATDTLTLVAGTGMTLTTNASGDTITFASSGGGGGGSLTIQDEGSSLSTAGTTLNFVGAGVVASGTGATKTITISGASASSVFQYTDAGMTEFEYTATANQTTFTGSDSNSATLLYEVGSIMVFLNGVLQDDGVDYTATNGTSVVFSSGVTASDEVRIVTISSLASVHNPTKLDAISTVNGQAAYALTESSSAYTPSHQNALVVSVNGITQEPGDSFTISGSTITFSPALVTGDVVDYIIDLGRKINISAPGYATVDDATALAIALG